MGSLKLRPMHIARSMAHLRACAEELLMAELESMMEDESWEH